MKYKIGDIVKNNITHSYYQIVDIIPPRTYGCRLIKLNMNYIFILDETRLRLATDLEKLELL